MRTREAILHSFIDLAAELDERMRALITVSEDSNLITRFDRVGTRILDDLRRLQTNYIHFVDKLDAAIGRSDPPTPRLRPSNVLSFRPRPRKKS